MIKKTLFFSVLLNSCGMPPVEDELPRPFKEARFMEDFASFIEIGKEYGFNIQYESVRYMNTDNSIYNGSIMGYCYKEEAKRTYYAPNEIKETFKFNTIAIVDDSILKLNNVSLSEIVYHELFQCTLNQVHDDDNPDDIMFPYVNSSSLPLEERVRNKFKEIQNGEQK